MQLPQPFSKPRPSITEAVSYRSLSARPQHLLGRASFLIFALAAVLFPVAAAHAQTTVVQTQGASFGNVPVGSASQAISIQFSIPTGTILSTPSVVTGGTTGLDFSNAGTGTCRPNQTPTSASTCTVDVTFTPRFAGARSGAVILGDTNGDVVATAYVFGVGQGPQVAFLPGAQVVVASGFTTRSPNEASGVRDVAADGSGNLYIVDSGSSKVLKETPSGGTYTQSTVGTDLLNPSGVAVDGAGNVYIADSGNFRVLKESLAGGAYSQTVIESSVYSNSVAVDKNGNVFIIDYSKAQLLKATPSGNTYTLSTVDSNFSDPSRVAVDSSGNLYVADTLNNRIVKETLSGGAYVASTLFDFTSPQSVAVDDFGNLYIGDSPNSRLVKETLSGTTYTQSTIASGFTDYGLITGVAVDASGNVYVGDIDDSRVLKFDFSDGPSLNFALTQVGSTSSDSPKSVTVLNIGNAPLNTTALTVSSNFAQMAGPGTPVDCAANSSLAPEASCNLSISFTPTVNGPITGTAMLTDNALNSSPATQKISLSGTGNLANQTISFPTIPTESLGTALSLSASSSSGLPISFTSLTPSVCTVSGANVTLLAGGSCTIQASQAGNGSYAAAAPASQTFTVLKPQSIAFNSISAGTVGATVALRASSNSGSGIPITFSSLTPGVCTVSGSTATLATGGTCTIQASQAGNSLYAAAPSVTQSFTVSTAAQTITFTGLPATATYGAAGPYTLTATASSGLPVTYSVTGPATVSGSTLTITGAGTVAVTASQAGNANYTAAPSITQTIVVSGASQIITFTGLPTTATYGAAGPYTLTATASSGLPVTYSVTGPATLSGSTLTITGAGTVAVTASQAGNANYKAAPAVTQTIAVSGASQTITFGAISPGTVGVPISLSASASSGLPISYVSLSSSICTVSGATVTPTAAGTCTLQASQPGNAQYAAATPISRSFAVSPATSFTITPDPGSETIKRGDLAGFILRFNSVNGFNGNVKVSCSGGPAGSYCANLPQVVSLNGTAYAVSGISFPKSTAPGTYTLTFTGVSGSLTNTATATFTVVQ